MDTEEQWTLDTFVTQDTLGVGSYSQVELAKSKITGKLYAIKCVHKLHLIRNKRVKYASIERDSMQRLLKAFIQSNNNNNNNNIPSSYFCCVKLFATLQDRDSLYYIMEYVPNGDLLKFIQENPSKAQNEPAIAYIGAQLIATIRFIHSHGIIHRDIKPENILFTNKWTIKLSDFGSARILAPLSGKDGSSTSSTSSTSSDANYNLLTRSNSFVGTAEYVTPELLTLGYVDYRCDYWAAACIFYQMKMGVPPFKDKTEYLTFKKITDGSTIEEILSNSPDYDMSSQLTDLIKGILNKNIDQRLNLHDIITHPFFKKYHIDFADLETIWSPKPELF